LEQSLKELNQEETLLGNKEKEAKLKDIRGRIKVEAARRMNLGYHLLQIHLKPMIALDQLG
jgi:hypothetical protein